ncbi:uncharacterized protein [Rutidosis leptorrhynchoides]|uniref:uncharacterized protein n=1 Tax=Rutidosis leptorrhynchoides TaxID=125765 RepID=UPI003A99BFE8
MEKEVASSSSTINTIDYLDLQEEKDNFKRDILVSKNIIKKIKKEELNLRECQDIRTPLRNLFSRKNILYFGKITAEYPIEISTATGETSIPIISGDEIKEKIKQLNIKQADKDKIGYIHISTVQILIKSTFMEGIDSPIRLAICDDRIQHPRDRIIGIVNGNLAYTKLKFNVSLQLGIPLCTENLDRSLILAYKFYRNNLMAKEDYPFTITYEIGYALSNSHHSIQFKDNDRIYLEDLFGVTAKVGTIKTTPISSVPRIDNIITKERIFRRPSMRLIRDNTNYIVEEESSSSKDKDIQKELSKLNNHLLTIESKLEQTL